MHTKIPRFHHSLNSHHIAATGFSSLSTAHMFFTEYKLCIQFNIHYNFWISLRFPSPPHLPTPFENNCQVPSYDH